MAVIKQLPGDFVVEEMQPGLEAGSGDYAYFWLEKTGLSTFEAVKLISDHFRISKDRIGFAGVKDRDAVTRQLVSIRGLKAAVAEIRIGNSLRLEYACQRDSQLPIGQLLGNKFTVAVRDLDAKEAAVMAENMALLKKNKKIPSYFDEQRFSSRNADVGRAIIRGSDRDAVAGILGCGSKDLSQDLYRKKISAARQFEAAVLNSLVKKPTDFNAALRSVPFHLRKMFVHAYQAFLFNKTAAAYITGTCGSKVKRVDYSLGMFLFPTTAAENRKIPIIGFATEADKIKDKKVAAITAAIMKDEDITPRSFIIRSMPELTSEGGSRQLLMEVKSLAYQFEEDELNKGKKKCTLTFALDKGCYATVVVKAMLAP